jgi:RNA polymerase-binding transcription factor DksA
MTIDLDHHRKDLVDLRARVLAAVAHGDHSDDDGAEINSPAGDQHLADHASDMFDREMDDSLGENAEQMLHEIDLALARIEAGTYGRCAECGDEIPGERLAAVPYATLCIEHKRKLERG